MRTQDTETETDLEDDEDLERETSRLMAFWLKAMTWIGWLAGRAVRTFRSLTCRCWFEDIGVIHDRRGFPEYWCQRCHKCKAVRLVPWEPRHVNCRCIIPGIEDSLEA